MNVIREIEGLSHEQIIQEIQQGARFVVFSYTISILIFTFKRSSRIFFIRKRESTFLKSLPYTLCSLFLGWWGIPWGIIYTPMSLFQNFLGGTDVTQDLLAAASSSLPMDYQTSPWSDHKDQENGIP